MSTPLLATAGDRYGVEAYRRYALGLLTATYTFNFLDRQILAILQEPIKRDMHLSDGQLGLLTGFSFAFFYILLGLPIARWADRGVRRDILAAAIGVWSLMTLLCGFAQQYWQLLLARIGVGVGEAGGSPPAHSMISNIFAPGERATALGTYSMGMNLGVLAGFLTGGWINELFGWRVAFLAAGLPGLLLAALIRMTLSEPQRPRASALPGAMPSIREVLQQLWMRRTFRHMVWGASLLSFAGYGLFNWFPSFLARTHGLGTGLIGTWLAIILGIGGALGTFGGGYLADRLSLRDIRWYAWVTVIAALVALPALVLSFIVESGALALLCFALPGALAAVCMPSLLAVTHSLIENRMRALASALVLFILNLLGLGLGPLVVGLLSDWLEGLAGVDSLRWAMLLVLPVATLWGSIHFLCAARHIRRELPSAT